MDGRQRAARAVEAQRGKLRMTRGALAQAAGIDPKTIYNLEEKGRWPTAATRAAIEQALGWSVGEMKRISEEAEPEPPAISPGLLAAIRREVDPADQERVIDALERTLRGEPQPPNGTAESGRSHEDRAAS